MTGFHQRPERIPYLDDQVLGRVARVLWEDAVFTGRLQDLAPQSWERNRGEFMRLALLVEWVIAGEPEEGLPEEVAA